MILRKQVVWKVLSLLRSFAVILLHSAPYNSTGRTLLLYSLSLVAQLQALDFHTGFNRAKADLAFPKCAVMSSSGPPMMLTVLPR